VRVARGKEPGEERNGQHGEELHEPVRAEIAPALLLARVPPEHADHAGHEKRAQQREAGARPDPLADHRGEETHEGHRHGQPIPDEPDIARIHVIPGGAESGQGEAREEHHPGPALPAVHEGHAADRAQGQAQPGPAGDQEGEIGQHVERIGHAQEVAGVG